MLYRRLFDMLLDLEKGTSKSKALHYRHGNTWEELKIIDLYSEVKALASGMLTLGLEKGDSLALMTRLGNPFPLLLELAGSLLGINIIILHPHLSNDLINKSLNEHQVGIILISNREQYDRITLLENKFITKIYTFEQLPTIPNYWDFRKAPKDAHLAEIAVMQGIVHEDDTATYYIDIAGRTNAVTHRAYLEKILALQEQLPFSTQTTFVSMLNLALFSERCLVYAALLQGTTVFFLSQEQLLKDFKRVKPNFITADAPLLSAAYTMITKKSPKNSKALQVALRYKSYQRLPLAYRIQLWWYDMMTYYKWRDLLGGELTGLITEKEAITTEQESLYLAAQIKIYFLAPLPEK